MPITAPTSAVEGTASLVITGSALDLVAPVYVVASNGTATYQIEQSVSARDANSITIDLDCGLAAKIAGDTTAFPGVPLTDSQWSLKWMVGADELSVVISPPSNYQQREVDDAEKFGGWLESLSLGDQSQIFGEIVTSTNTVKHTESNGKATGYLDGIERTMTELITHRVFTAGDGKWRDLPVQVTQFGFGGLYVNSYLVGGAASGPVGGNNPPSAHAIGFNTVESFPESIGGGAFKWVINDAKDSGRSFLQYDLAANNPDLEVGERYALLVQCQSDASTIALTTSGASDVVVTPISVNAVAGQTVTLELEILIAAPSYQCQIRYGVGTTTTRDDRMEVFGAQLVKKPSVSAFTEEFTDEFE